MEFRSYPLPDGDISDGGVFAYFPVLGPSTIIKPTIALSEDERWGQLLQHQDELSIIVDEVVLETDRMPQHVSLRGFRQTVPLMYNLTHLIMPPNSVVVRTNPPYILPYLALELMVASDQSYL